MVSHYEDCWHMSEFYVVPAFRRKNIGTNSARLLIDTHPGIWIIEFNSYNEAGRRLWNKVASEKAVSDIKNGITEEGHLYLRFKTTR